MSEAIRKLSRLQRQTFDRLYLDGPTRMSEYPATKQTLIRKLEAKGLALIVSLPRRGETAMARFPLQPGDIGHLDTPRTGAYVELIKVGRKCLLVRRTRGLAGKPIGAPFEVEPYRFIYVISRGISRVRKPQNEDGLFLSARA